MGDGDNKYARLRSGCMHGLGPVLVHASPIGLKEKRCGMLPGVERKSAGTFAAWRDALRSSLTSEICDLALKPVGNRGSEAAWKDDGECKNGHGNSLGRRHDESIVMRLCDSEEVGAGGNAFCHLRSLSYSSRVPRF
jgi:hypothetical protein